MARGKGADTTSDRPGRQMNKCCMARGKGRTPAVTDLEDKRIEMLHGQRKRADTTSDRTVGDKGIEMLHGQRKRADTS